MPLLFQKTIARFVLLPPWAEMVPLFMISLIVALLIDIIPRVWTEPVADIVPSLVIVFTTAPVSTLMAPEFNAESVTLMVPLEALLISVRVASWT